MQIYKGWEDVRKIRQNFARIIHSSFDLSDHKTFQILTQISERSKEEMSSKMCQLMHFFSLDNTFSSKLSMVILLWFWARYLSSQCLPSPRNTNGYLKNFLEIHARWTSSSGSIALFLHTSQYKNWDTLWRVMSYGLTLYTFYDRSYTKWLVLLFQKTNKMCIS